MLACFGKVGLCLEPDPNSSLEFSPCFEMVLGSCWGESPHKCEGLCQGPFVWPFFYFCKLELLDAGRSLTKLLQDKPPGLGSAGASSKGACG